MNLIEFQLFKYKVFIYESGRVVELWEGPGVYQFEEEQLLVTVEELDENLKDRLREEPG